MITFCRNVMFLVLINSVVTEINTIMVPYMVTFAGDACLAMGAGSLVYRTYVTRDVKKKLIDETDIKPSQMNQLAKDFAKIVPYESTLLPVGGCLSIAGRLGMLKSCGFFPGTFLSITSVPLHGALMVSIMLARCFYAPDKTWRDTGADVISRLAKKIQGQE